MISVRRIYIDSRLRTSGTYSYFAYGPPLNTSDTADGTYGRFDVGAECLDDPQ